MKLMCLTIIGLLVASSRTQLAVVTGGNKGVGLEVCCQLALQGVTVILTARDEKRGEDAVQSIRHESNLSNLIFHQLDVRDNDSVASLARYIESRYGKLDILVNNAAVIGVAADEEGLKALNIDAETWRMPNEKLRNELSNIDIWDEERIEAVLNTFLEDLKNGRLEEAG